MYLHDSAAAARVIPPGARVFVTTGRADLPALRTLRATLLVRVLDADPGPFPLPRGRFVSGTGPFTQIQEQRLLRRLRIDWLLLRDAGGPGGWPKLAAARALGLPVALIRRPAPPPGRLVTSIEEVLTWLAKI